MYIYIYGESSKLTWDGVGVVAWSDDRLKANFHRVRAKGKDDKDRYSIAYFNTGRRNFVMQGPEKK